MIITQKRREDFTAAEWREIEDKARIAIFHYAAGRDTTDQLRSTRHARTRSVERHRARLEHAGGEAVEPPLTPPVNARQYDREAQTAHDVACRRLAAAVELSVAPLVNDRATYLLAAVSKSDTFTADLAGPILEAIAEAPDMAMIVKCDWCSTYAALFRNPVGRFDLPPGWSAIPRDDCQEPRHACGPTCAEALRHLTADPTVKKRRSA